MATKGGRGMSLPVLSKGKKGKPRIVKNKPPMRGPGRGYKATGR